MAESAPIGTEEIELEEGRSHSPDQKQPPGIWVDLAVPGCDHQGRAS